MCRKIAVLFTLSLCSSVAAAVSTFGVEHGLWVFNSTDGKVQFCSSYIYKDTGGACKVMATIELSTKGYDKKTAGPQLFIRSKQTGAVYQCYALWDPPFINNFGNPIPTGNCLKLPEYPK